MAITTKLRQKPQNPKQFQRLVFVEGRVKHVFLHKDFRLPGSKCLFSYDVQIDVFVVIAKIMINRNTRKHLHHLSLRPDVEIKIASQTFADSIRIAMNDLGIGLGSAITRKTVVQMVPGQS